MVIVYTSPGCASCRKAKRWLTENHISYLEKNIFSNLMLESEIKYLLSRCENGTTDIISTRSKAFQSLQKDINDYTVRELIVLIQRNPSILKRPIMLSERTMVVGYDDDEITALIPQGNRESQRDEMPGTLSLPAAQCTSGVRRI